MTPKEHPPVLAPPAKGRGTSNAAHGKTLRVEKNPLTLPIIAPTSVSLSGRATAGRHLAATPESPMGRVRRDARTASSPTNGSVQLKNSARQSAPCACIYWRSPRPTSSSSPSSLDSPAYCVCVQHTVVSGGSKWGCRKQQPVEGQAIPNHSQQGACVPTDPSA
jgi:hypothetical protein